VEASKAGLCDFNLDKVLSNICTFSNGLSFTLGTGVGIKEKYDTAILNIFTKTKAPEDPGSLPKL
jgi:hypothetical protein